MQSIKKIFQISLLIYFVILSNLYGIENEKCSEQNRMNVLLVADDNFGSKDLYISFRDKSGKWMKEQNLGERVAETNECVC